MSTTQMWKVANNNTTYTSSRGTLFWLAVSGSRSCFITQSTAGQCMVVNRAPMPRDAYLEALQTKCGMNANEMHGYHEQET